MRKLAFCICENKDADQHLCFRYTDSTIPLLPIYEIPLLPINEYQTWSETPKTGCLTTRLIFFASFTIMILCFPADGQSV